METKTFACQCGSIRFSQPVVVHAKEIVELQYTSDEVLPISHEMSEISEENIEHANEFVCVVCGEEHIITLKDGKYGIQ